MKNTKKIVAMTLLFSLSANTLANLNPHSNIKAYASS